MDFLYLIFMLAWGFGFCMWRRTLAEYSAVILPGLAGNLGDLTVASSQYDILLWSEILVSEIRHMSELLVLGFGRPVLLCRGKMPWARGMAAYVRVGYGAFHQPKFERGCCEMLVFRVCGVRLFLYVFSLYRNPDLDDRIFDCLLASVAAVQVEDIRAFFLIVGNLNGHHQEWLGSTTTNRHGVAALTLQLSPFAISWLSAQPMDVVEHLNSKWLMSLTEYGLLL